MTQPPDETPDFLAKPVPPSGDQAPPPPPPADPTSPYVGQQPPGGYQSYAAPPPTTPGYGYPVPGQPGYPFAQAHGGANTAMGLGIASVVCAVGTFVCCLAFVGVFTGPFAVVLALRARKEMAASPGLYHNEGAATTGLVTGLIGSILGALAILLVIFVFGAIIATDDM